ncbi:MAG: glycosyltransferase family 4 protein [Lentimicrobium sp.]|jgi:glycosyltransferase involved in cell wall biosynthesis|nr:glycosyltransferase family 4 protein [Lentimicrobium sp.]
MRTILSIIDWYLPGYRAGGTLKAFANQVAQLEGKFRFKIITRDTDYCETMPYTNVTSNSWNQIATNAEAYYISSGRLSVSEMTKLFKNTGFDTVYVHGIYSFYFSVLPVILAKQKKTPRIVITAHGMLGEHALKVKSFRKKAFLKLAGMLGLYKGVIFHAANEAEAADIKKSAGKNARVIIAEELPMKIDLEPWSSKNKTTGELTITSVARISPEKNTLFALEVLSRCNTGNITYDIFGPVYDEEYWTKCLAVIERMPATVKVTYKGSVEGKLVLDTLRSYHLMFMPTTGENFGHTILESFMAATPVLISDKTPWQLPEQKRSGWALPLDEKEKFSNIINSLAQMNAEQYNHFSLGAHEKAVEFMADQSVLLQNIKLFEDEKN